MATPVFAGYLIKEIDQARCPEEYNLSGGEESNSYTVYVLLESFKTKETDIWDLPTNADSELRQSWSEFFKEHVRIERLKSTRIFHSRMSSILIVKMMECLQSTGPRFKR